MCFIHKWSQRSANQMEMFETIIFSVFTAYGLRVIFGMFKTLVVSQTKVSAYLIYMSQNVYTKTQDFVI